MNPPIEYLNIIVLLHVAFAVVFYFTNRQRATQFAYLFAFSWAIEAVRAAILLPQVHNVGGWSNGWYALADVLCYFANWCLLAGVADLVKARLPRWLAPAYLGSGIPLVLFNRFVLPHLLQRYAGIPFEEARFYGVATNLVLMFVPVTISRLVILIWLYRLWQDSRVPGALIATIFCVPYAVFALLAPLQFIYGYYPEWIPYVWCLRVLGFSIGLVILMLSLQHQAVVESEASLSAAQALAKVGSWEFDLTTQQGRWSDEAFRLLGRDAALGAPTLEEFVGLVHPEDRESLERDRERMVKERRSTETVFRFQRLDGRTLWIAYRATPVWDSRGEISRLVGTMQDITERREAEIRIEHLNRVYAVLSDINQTIIRVHEPRQVFSAACTIAVEKGRFRMAWIGEIDPETNQLELVAHAGANAEVIEIVKHVMHGDPPFGKCHWVARALRHGEVSTGNDIAHDPDAVGWRDAALAAGYRSGASLPLKIRDKIFGVMNLYAGETDFFDADEIRLLDELAVDISFAVEVYQRECDRKRAEAALHESEERFRQMTEAIREVFWLADPISNHVLYISPAYESVWGRSRAELYGNPQAWMDALHPEDRNVLAADHVTIAEGFDYDREYRIIRGDGELRWIHARAFPVRNAAGEVYRVAGVAEDVTDRKELEAQFRQSQKLEAIGQLSGGIAHDFNNVLTVILGSVYLVRTGSTLPPAVSEALDEIVQAGTRAANLTRQLLMFSRRQVLEPRILDLNAVVITLAKMLRRVLREDVVLDVATPPEPVPIRADQGMLEQVLLNLAVNSRDAMPRGGRLEIATSIVSIAPGAGTRPAHTRTGEFACLTVVDTGVGIPPEVLPRIFEPYFTTKDVGKGTGLGLATVFGIVDQHGGWINVNSVVGQGTRFEVYLPLHGGAVEPAPTAPAMSREPTDAQGTILLVEDEDAVRRVARLTLVRAGFRVLEAGNAREAMNIWRQQREQIDLLLTDLVMPEGISGRELAEQLVPEKPRLGVIYMSGYSPEIAGRGLVLNEGVNFLSKPYEPERLADVVREMWQWTRRPASGQSRPPIGPTG